MGLIGRQVLEKIKKMAKDEKFERRGLLENGALVGTYNSQRDAERAKRKAESEAFDIGELYNLVYTIVPL